MPVGLSRRMRRTLSGGLIVAALAATTGVHVAAQPAAMDEALRRQVEARFDVVPLKDGLALAGRTADRRIEIDRGVILSQGVPLSGDELRRRFGADADLVLRLSYLDNDALRRLFATAPPAVPPQPVVPPVSPVPAAAPTPVVPPPPPAAAVLPADPVFDRPSATEAGPVFHRTGARIGVGKTIVVASDEEVTDGVYSLGGSVRIDGRVRDGVVVVGSDLELSPTADVRGDLTVIGGELRIAEGARHAGAVHHGAGTPWPRWSWPTVGWSWFEPGGAASWLPLAGTTTRILLLAVLMAILAVFAPARVARIGAAAVATPVRAGLVGLVAQVLFVPALIVLAVVMAITIVGLPFVAVVVPLAVLAMLATMLLGFTSLAGRVGRLFVGEAAGEGAAAAALAGLAIIVLPTLLARLVGVGPDWLRFIAVALLVVGTAIEYVAWTMGLGAAIVTGLGRWAVVPPPVPPSMAPEPVIEPSAVL